MDFFPFFSIFKSNAKTRIANVIYMNVKVTAQSNMLVGWLETARKHARSVQVYLAKTSMVRGVMAGKEKASVTPVVMFHG